MLDYMQSCLLPAIVPSNHETFVPDSKSCRKDYQDKDCPSSYNHFAQDDHAFFFQRDAELGRPQKRALTSCLPFSAYGNF